MRKIIYGLLALLAIGFIPLPDEPLIVPIQPATAQSVQCPNQSPAFTAGGNVFGRLSSQWNQYFASKVDSVNGVLCNPTIIGLQPPVVPNADLLGGLNSEFTVITVGSGLNLTAGTLTATGSGGTVTSVGLSVPATSILGVTGSPVTGSGTLGLTTTGTSGGIPYFSSGTQLATSAALTANAPVIGGGAGVAPTVGSRSGNTTVFGTTSGSLTSGNLASFDASGNIIASGIATTEVNTQRLAIGWPSGIDPTGNIIATIDQASTVVSIVGTVTTPLGAAGTVLVYKAPSATACAAGTLLHTGSFDANGTANTNQILTLAGGGAPSLTAGDRICLDVTDDANWLTGAAIGGVTVRMTTP